jgi:hypothetical protein
MPRYVEKGSNEFVQRLKRVRELTGLGLMECRTLVDIVPGLEAEEIAERYKRAVDRGQPPMINLAFPSTHYQVKSTKWPELDGFFPTLSPALMKLASENPNSITILEYVLKKDVYEKLALAALMAD